VSRWLVTEVCAAAADVAGQMTDGSSNFGTVLSRVSRIGQAVADGEDEGDGDRVFEGDGDGEGDFDGLGDADRLGRTVDDDRTGCGM
jgi:hypothetical protein